MLWAQSSGWRSGSARPRPSLAAATSPAGQLATKPRTNARLASRRRSPRSLARSTKHSPRASTARRRPGSSSTARAGALLLWLLPILALGAGCCSGQASGIRPHLPPGKPEDRTQLLLQREASWKDVVGNKVLLPQRDLEMLIEDGLEWKTWAAALAKAGRWR